MQAAQETLVRSCVSFSGDASDSMERRPPRRGILVERVLFQFMSLGSNNFLLLLCVSALGVVIHNSIKLSSVSAIP